MRGEKRYIVEIRKKMSSFFIIDGRKIRAPVKFVAQESQLPLIKSKLRMEEVHDYDITEIENDNKFESRRF